MVVAHFPAPTPIPASIGVQPTALFIGIDVGKRKHIAAFASPLIQRGKRSVSPTFSFTNSRAGFESFLKKAQSYGPEQVHILLEKTGHYSSALIEYLQQAPGIIVYVVHAHKRLSRDKTDEIDARGLAQTLFNQVGLGAKVIDAKDAVRRYAPPAETARQARGMARHRFELSREITRRKNKIGAIVDEIFPEMTQVIKNPCCETALNLLERFTTPAAIAQASFAEVKACRPRSNPGNTKLLELQKLASESIGITEQVRVETLCFELVRLIEQLRMLSRHAKELDARLDAIVRASREGQILLSFGIIGPTQAAMIIAAISNIDNFEKPSELRALFGWCPVRTQTGTSKDIARLTKGGNRMAKQTLFFVGMDCAKNDCEWRDAYRELIKKHCVWDARLKAYKGKMKAMSRMIGRLIGTIFYLLKKDRDLLASLKPGEEPPPPTLYSRETHAAHRRR